MQYVLAFQSLESRYILPVFRCWARHRNKRGRGPSCCHRRPTILIRPILLFLGHLSLAAGFIGIFVPLWPTTPFVLLAAICYSRGSERFHTWIHGHRVFGPILDNWERHGVIPLHAKMIAALGLSASIVFFSLRLGYLWGVVAVVVAAGVLTFLFSRPSKIPTGSPEFNNE